MKILNVLKDKKGNGTITTVFLVLIITIIASAFFEYARLQIIASGVRDSFQMAIINVATENYDNLDYTLKDSYAGAYSLNGEEWNVNIEEGDVYRHLDKLLGLENHESRSENGELLYSLSKLNIETKNVEITPNEKGDRDGKFTVTGTIHLKVPLTFGWGDQVPPMEIDLKVKAGWYSKF